MASDFNHFPPKISGAIFDLDGTILDTMEQWDNLGVRYLREHNIEPKQDLLDRIGTMTLRESAQLFHDEYGVNLEVSQIIEELIGLLRNLYAREAKVKPGAIETLRTLKRAGVEIALATATSRELAYDGLHLVGALKFFNEVFSCRDPQIREGKTSPKIFDYARSFLGAPASEIIVVEDALYALETAKRAGYFTIGIADPCERTRKEKIKQTVDVYVENHAELVQWLHKALQE